MARKSGRSLLCGVVCAAVFAACNTTPDELQPIEPEETGFASPAASPHGDLGLALAPQQRFPDVPLPADLREDTARTYVYQAPGIEVGRMVYTTKASTNDIAQFFIRECPAADWKLDSVTQAENGVQLIFNKPGKRLDVSARDQGLARSRELVLHLTPVPNTDMQP